MSERRHVVGLGELLWDLLPEGPLLGGAVSNFAVMSARLGNHAYIASRIGLDQLGREATIQLSRTPVDTSYIQEDFSRLTGSVTVSIAQGQPQYIIHEPVAWDSLEFTPHWLSLAERADAVCFGTLAQRSPTSRRTIGAFLSETKKECVRVFDVNLRAPFYDADVLEQSMESATILKLNSDEMPVVLKLLGFPHSGESTPDALLGGARLLLDQFPIALVAITLGAHGSLLITGRQVHRHPGHPCQVADTIGAGDAFTAALTHFYLQGAPLAMLSEAGNRWGAWVASQPGAMPVLSDEKRSEIMAEIEAVAKS
jgi:fructokinase